MFGYVRPFHRELKVREFEQFKAAYCGLCHTLGKKYGFAARFILNYDFTFLAMLFSNREEKPEYEYCRCVAHPLKKRCCCKKTQEFDTAAGYSVILAYWQLKDGVADSGFFKSMLYRGLALLLRGAYKKAAGNFTEFDLTVKERLSELITLEKEGCATLDLTADKFACILEAMVPAESDDNDRRIMRELLYHTGRWIYIIDACDDYKRDKETGSYNPLLKRFEPGADDLNPEDKSYLKTTLLHSANLVLSAYELMRTGAWSGILRNIIYLGFPWTTDMVIKGKWQKPKSKLRIMR